MGIIVGGTRLVSSLLLLFSGFGNYPGLLLLVLSSSPSWLNCCSLLILRLDVLTIACSAETRISTRRTMLSTLYDAPNRRRFYLSIPLFFHDPFAFSRRLASLGRSVPCSRQTASLASPGLAVAANRNSVETACADLRRADSSWQSRLTVAASSTDE